MIPWGAAISGGASILGGLLGGGGAAKAAQAQADAQKQAIQAQQQQFGQTSNNLAPFLQTGTLANLDLGNALGLGGSGLGAGSLVQSPQSALGPPPDLGTLSPYTGPDLSWLGPTPKYNEPAFTREQFQSSPGYEFQKQQGIDAIQNSAVGKAGTLSGNTLKALDTFGTGLANQDWWNAYNKYHTNYVNQYNSENQNYWNQANSAQSLYDKTYGANNTNSLNQYNAQNQNYWKGVDQGNTTQNRLFQMLSQLSGQGQNAAVQQGGFGAGAANQIGDSLKSIGGAQAGGILGATGAATSAIGGVGNALLSPTGGDNAITKLIALLSGGGGGLANNNQFAMSLNSAPYTV